MKALFKKYKVAETAGIGGLLDALQTTLKTAQDVTQFGAGEGQVRINVSPKDALEAWEDSRKKGKDKKKMAGLRARKGKKIDGVKNASLPDKAKPVKKATKADKPKMPIPAKQAARPDNRKPAKLVRKQATKDVEITGKTLDGKTSKITIKKGTWTSTVKTAKGLELHRQGQKPIIVSPSDVSKI